MEDNYSITAVRKGSFFDKEFSSYSISTVVDDEILYELERKTGLRIALALEYREYGELNQILIVSTDRKHYKIYWLL